MTRTYVVTGSASGIGAATAERLGSDGHVVIGVDRQDATVCVDLATESGRQQLRPQVEAISGMVDGVVAAAGTSGRGAVDVAVDYFGAVATLAMLRPLLTGSPAPRAVAVVSFAVVSPVDDELVRGCLAGDEATALERAGALPPAEPFLAYASAKRALARWVRRTAPTESWAGAGIALNAVAPGIVRTPMTQSFLEDDTMRRTLEAMVPMPLGGITDAETVAESIVFLASPLAAAITGQVLFVDGGADCVRRGDDVWTSAG